MALAHIEGPPLSRHDVPRETALIAGFGDSRADHPALVLGHRRVSFAELDRRTRAAIRLFAARGLAPGDRIAWIGINNPDFIAVMLAAMRSGLVLVPLNWRLKPRELAFLLADSGARAVFADTAFTPAIAEANTGHIPVIVTDGPAPDDLPALLVTTDADPADPLMGGTFGGVALMLYTSGTTGQPKGVQIAEQALALARQMEADQGGFDDWGDDEVLLSPLPLFHIGGISWALCGLHRGCTVVLTNDLTPAALLDLCLAEDVTRTFMVPQLVRGLIGEMLARNVRATHLKGIHYGAAPMDPPLLARGIAEIGCRFLQYFGMTEMSGTISILPPGDHDPARPHLLRSVGRVLPGSAIQIRDADGHVVERGVAGEIWTRGPTMMLGYANRPEQTAAAIVDGWYRTGDGGKIDAEGFLTLTDRIKDMIVTGGENVYPAEVEAVLREHPAVADCAVFGLPDAVWGERVCAAIESRAGASVDAEAIAAFLKPLIAGFKLPRQLFASDGLPRTASGKVQRGKLREQMLEQVSC
ncbi:AMP-binding protein [Novosphingobium lentum]|uniref:AMP-binding protein n=1 Tax=Novosphingobium lentum TaxID=145287 RepID=UPI00082D7693|nr:AMP-binding protein [Novosphingobium lentum]